MNPAPAPVDCWTPALSARVEELAAGEVENPRVAAILAAARVTGQPTWTDEVIGALVRLFRAEQLACAGAGVSPEDALAQGRTRQRAAQRNGRPRRQGEANRENT